MSLSPPQKDPCYPKHMASHRNKITCPVKEVLPGESFDIHINLSQTIERIYIGLSSDNTETEDYLKKHWSATYYLSRVNDWHLKIKRTKTGKERSAPPMLCNKKYELLYTQADLDQDMRKAEAAAGQS